MVKKGPENIQTRKLAANLEATGRKNKSGLWERVASILNKPSRSRCEVNLDRLDKITKEGDTAVVAGKILGNGALTHKLTIAYWKASASALEKIKASGSKAMTLAEMAEKNPKGSKTILVK
ncbi:50S ribosomal protein L18e [Candidatus Micrarchaeota archaeon CG_4_10_14_0_2_um_filter_60_11]|nr:MAG: hypothetical protein AUJ16_04160 [Candidatus Micrarchaeota archaeon CG1_02_60_51]PIN95863.1 MAG: 50S ribosomal protein L18e [Candidatus Micrarchaeota archaeon CG10_big_fil_rev_8_21_14_0_10_60_32]PIO02308.1 MAG: 50S ribosomal protein L18e [Candidatus Micrarchaeota archaeon CG09_land_8_20_14_0_10_60_16]PIY91291.1 MAG: 50S ribosomal protein L18e [Candidatus Micrarchaeota archaeon CG_4_10_14_0_8_um_filter_60_7]PIZ91260.1 MAG: 50S ribosomal protein L18e [Candidatus Micrarchaeota archaeon CG_